MELPLLNTLKKKAQIEIAELQDKIVEIVYASWPDSVLHGGTAIWRCYNGKRFSIDLDFYFHPRHTRVTLQKNLEIHFLHLLKYKETEESVFSLISDGNASVKLEGRKRHVIGTAMPYTTANGGKTSVLTLKPEEIIIEKIAAYSKRRLIRDVYDIYHLTSLCEDLETKKAVRKFLIRIEKPLDSEKVLEDLIYSGVVPSFQSMVEYLRRWSK